MKYSLKYCIGSRIRRLSRVTDRYFRELLVDFNITENQMTILFALREMGKMEQGKIGHILALERSTVSRNIKLLEKQNLLIRTSDYRPEIELSTEGNKLVKTLIPLWEQTMDILTEKLGNEGLKYLNALENKIK